MKRIFKKNQIIIAALAVMIAAAGYLNYSGRLFADKDSAAETNADLANKELLDISRGGYGQRVRRYQEPGRKRRTEAWKGRRERRY